MCTFSASLCFLRHLLCIAVETDETILSDRFAKNGHREDFEQIVTRYLPLVYSAAHRVLSGDVHLAQDVSQMVFINLARKIGSLPSNVSLSGWLYRDAYFTSLEMLRSQRRRTERESKFMEVKDLEDSGADWRQISPVLDDAMNHLSPAAREVLLLRFFEDLSLKQIGEKFGLSESAVSRRVSDGLESLRHLLREKGVT